MQAVERLDATRPLDYGDEWRCTSCNRVLARMALGPGSVLRLRCPDSRCRAWNVATGPPISAFRVWLHEIVSSASTSSRST